MEPRKIIFGGHLAFSILVWFVVGKFWDWCGRAFDIHFLVANIDLIHLALPIIVGLGTFGFLERYRRWNEFFMEAILEVKKISWPTQKQTAGATLVVIITVVIISFLLGLFDSMWSLFIRK